MVSGIWKFDSNASKTTGINLEYMFPDSRFQKMPTLAPTRMLIFQVSAWALDIWMSFEVSAWALDIWVSASDSLALDIY
uniref:Uncharacterized protein n=1 Tax=Rhizophagus irregularis (strain DAOM 181602 / DAOM 197198 / MUCL 43194) TaxID=747089 RepID=U9TC79_RHIID